MNKMALSAMVLVLASLTQAAIGQAASAKTQLLATLAGRFRPTRFTPDNSQIVNEGSIVTVKKEGLLLYPASLPAAPTSSFKKDKLSQNFLDLVGVGVLDSVGHPSGYVIPSQKLGAGQNVRVRAIDLGKDCILVEVVTEPYDDGRYFGVIKFPTPKGSVPSPEDGLRMVSEVLEVQPNQDQPTQEQASPAQPPREEEAASLRAAQHPAPAEPKYKDFDAPAPPPPPAPTAFIGEPKSQVAADFGEPQRKAVAGQKEIFFYSDLKMKVTFTAGKVSSIE